MRSLATTLSRQTADASTPEPTYGTSSSSSRPWTVPSSPNGPCRTGKATSAPSSPRPGRERELLAVAAARCRRARASRRTTSWPASSQAGGDALAAGQRDVVLRRAPARRARRRASGARAGVGASSSSGVVVVSVPGSGFSAGLEAADGDRHRRAALDLVAVGPGRLLLHEAVLVGRVDRLPPRRRPRSRAATAASSRGSASARRRRARRRAWARSRRSASPSRRAAACPARASGSSTVPGSASASSFSCTTTRKASSAARASSSRLADDVGHGQALGPEETSIVTALPRSESEPAVGRLRRRRG